MTTDRVFYVLGIYTVLSPAALLATLALPSLVGRPLPERVVNRLIQFAIATGLMASLTILGLMLATGMRHVPLELGHWVNLETEHFHFKVKFVFDRLSVPFVILTYSLCGTISAFAHSYLHREPGFNRFFVCFALFLLGMIIASVAGTIEMLYAGWELVGLSSALLVAFFHERQSPVRNGLRVWTVYRIADAAFLVAAVAMHHLTGEGDFDKLMGAGAWPAGHASLTPSQALFIGLLLLVAAAGKSALVPFSGWLPRAMEGPTPSSAVFYGALSVHLGAFLLLRVSPLLDLSPTLSAIVVLEGLATAAFAALASRVQADIKTALAFASLTQVGIIVAEIGLGLRYIPLIHIIGHACLRTLQLVRAPTLLHDYHQMENAIGGHLPKRPTIWQRIVPEKLRVRVYRFALERGFFDAVLDDFVVRPFVRLFRGCDALERRWTDFLAGRQSRESDQLNVARVAIDELQ